MTEARAARLPHVPALDGVRGLAVVAVLVLHAGPASWLPGGFLGVSLFFTLSGYLIASLLLVEVDHDGSVSLSDFWARRVRRLVPALVVTALGVVVMSRFVDLPSSTTAEVLGGLGYVANWVQLAGDRSYGDLFAAPSAVTHLWSLAIEEQFYVLFPLLVWFAARRVPAGLRRVYVVGGLVVIAVGVVGTRIVGDTDVAYYATPARIPEIAVGTVLAGLWPMGSLAAWWRADHARPAWAAAAVNVAGAVAVGISVLAWARTELTDPWIAEGGLTLYAMVSGAVLLAVTAPGPLSAALASWPLRSVGKISYGLYLYHWPVVVLLSPPRVDLGPVALFAARCALALGLSVVSYFAFEQPIRRARIGSGATPGAVIGYGFAALVATGLVAVVGIRTDDAASEPVRPAPAVIDPGAPPSSAGGAPSSSSPDGEPPASPPEHASPGPPVVAIMGDSVPNWLVRDGGWSLDPEQVALIDGTSEGCDGAEGAPVGRAGTGVEVTLPESCTGWRTQYPPVVEATSVDVAVLAVGTGAVLDRRLDGEFVGPCTERAADWYRSDLVERLRYLDDHVDRVVLVLPAWAEEWSGWVNPSDHRVRTDCVRTTLREAVDEVGPEVVVDTIDLGEHLCPDGPDDCRAVRSSDGVHVDPEAAPEVLGWIIDQATA